MNMLTERLCGAMLIGVAEPPDATDTEWEWSAAEEDVVEGTSMECV